MTINTGNLAALEAALKGDTMNALVASTPGGIERQEAAGQQTLVASTDMPRELRPGRGAYEKVGFTFGDAIDGVFQTATLPDGWTRIASDHSMHSYINDQHGRKRVGVFYKAAFYDRRASAELYVRYTARCMYPSDPGFEFLVGEQSIYAVVDAATDGVLWKSEMVEWSDRSAYEAIEKAAQAWIDQNFPDHRDATAYWND